jgi:hypothetical protein
MFRVAADGGDAQRKDDLANPTPTVTALAPATATAGSAELRLTIHGAHFVKGVSVVRIDGVPVKPEVVSTEQLVLTVPATALAHARTAHVTVYNPPPGGGESQPPAILIIA